MASFKILFRPSTRREKRGSLLIRIIHNRKIKHLTTEFKLFPEEWKRLERYLTNPERFPPPLGLEKIASELCIMTGHLEVLERGLMEQTNGIYSVEDIVSAFYLRSQGDNLGTFVRTITKELRRAGQERTARAYTTTFSKVVAFAKGKNIKFQAINSYFVKAFENELRQEGLMINTISFYLRNLRAIYNKGLLCGLAPAHGGNPFKYVRINTQNTKKRALTLDEMRQLHNLDFSDLLREDPGKETRIIPALSQEGEALRKSLYHAWRLFLFSFHARGMSFVDMAYLRKENLRGNSICYYRKKTGSYIEVRVNPEMQQIINSFREDVKKTKYLFPIIQSMSKPERQQYESALRQQNARLKLLGELAGLNHPISTHVARHSWATIAKRQNLPLGIISEGLGHSDIRTTSIYLDSFERHVLDRATDRVSASLFGKEEEALSG